MEKPTTSVKETLSADRTEELGGGQWLKKIACTPHLDRALRDKGLTLQACWKPLSCEELHCKSWAISI